MKLAWPIEIDMPGNAFGYSTLNRSLLAAVQAEGAEITDDADVGLFVGPADLFDPQWPVNILYTMYETETIPPSWVERCNRASAVLVPCTHNRQAFKRSGVSVPIYAVHLGIHAEQWPTVQRAESHPFRILMVGYPNQRKGLDTLAMAFWQAFLDDPDVELYLKTSQAYSSTKVAYTLRGVERFTVDDRQISHDELVSLYHSAHVFVLPSRGEGWGFPAMEAMATGCPVVATDYSGLREFVTPHSGWPIRHGWSDVDYGHRTRAAEPDVEHLIDLLTAIRRDYARAATKAVKAAEWLKAAFTWQQTAERVLACIERVTAQRRNCGRLHTRTGEAGDYGISSRLAASADSRHGTRCACTGLERGVV